MGGCMGQKVGSGQMTNLIKLELINIIWFSLKIYNLSRHPYLWVEGVINGWAHVKPLKSNKSWPNRDNSIIDILLDILLKPPQPLMGLFFFVQCFTIIIIKCKALFSCHSSSSHYSTQGFVLITFHFIFSFLKNKILCNFTCDLLLSFWISELKCGHACGKYMTKNSKVNGSLRENISIFWSHLLALISRRNVVTRGHWRKEIILLKYKYFRFSTKTGTHFELLNCMEKSNKLLM